MNKDRRKRIAAVLVALAPLKEELEALQGEEQDAFENMPEGLQQSERGQESETAAENLDEAATSIGSAIDELESIE